jgi:hypothetical protein
LIPVIAAFVRTVDFMDRLREEGHVQDYALIGGLALSAWAEPRNTRDVDLVVSVAEGTTWPGIAALVESGFRKKTVVKRGTRRTTIQDKLSFVAGQIEVDLIGTRGFPLADEAMENALVATVFGRKVKMATAWRASSRSRTCAACQQKIPAIGCILPWIKLRIRNRFTEGPISNFGSRE